MKQKISIIIPAHNEEKRIDKTLEEYLKFFSNLKKEKILDFEIIVVLNACIDKTKEVAEKNKCKELRILEFKQGGKGFAVTQGFKDALTRKNDLIGFVDADMATSPESFYDLIENIKEKDGIIASRGKKGANANMNPIRRLTHKGFNFIIRSLFLMPYKDTQCGAKIFKKGVVESIIPGLSLTHWVFDVNLLHLCKKNKFKIKEHPTIWKNKSGSKISSITRTSFQMFLGAIRLRILNSPFKDFVRLYDKINKKRKNEIYKN